MSENLRVIRKKPALEKLGISNATLHNWMNPGSKYHKQNFPKRVRMGGVVGFLEHELDAFILAAVDR